MYCAVVGLCINTERERDTIQNKTESIVIAIENIRVVNDETEGKVVRKDLEQC